MLSHQKRHICNIQANKRPASAISYTKELHCLLLLYHSLFSASIIQRTEKYNNRNYNLLATATKAFLNNENPLKAQETDQ